MQYRTIVQPCPQNAYCQVCRVNCDAQVHWTASPPVQTMQRNTLQGHIHLVRKVIYPRVRADAAITERWIAL